MHVLGKALVILGMLNLGTACGVSTNPAMKAPHKTHYPIVELNLSTIHILGVGKYTLKVPASYVSGNSPRALIMDMPQGAIWMTPPNFMGAHQNPLHGWNLWFTPWQKARESLWSQAHLLQHYPSSAQFEVLGDTGANAVFSETHRGITRPIVANVQTQKVTELSHPITTSFSMVEEGFLLYRTGRQMAAIALPSLRQSLIPLNNQSLKAMRVVSGGIQVDRHKIPVSEVPTLRGPLLPPGYRWMGFANTLPTMAVPQDWIIRANSPGGSSMELIAANPSNPLEKATIWFNACVGCSSPDGGLGLMTGPDSPALGAPFGQVHWINDHVVMLPMTTKHGMTTVNETLVWPNGGSGNLEVSLTLPTKDIKERTTMLTTLLKAWRQAALTQTT